MIQVNRYPTTLGLVFLTAASLALAGCSSSSHAKAAAVGSTFSDPASTSSTAAVGSTAAASSTAPPPVSTTSGAASGAPTSGLSSLPSSPVLAAIVIQPAELPGWQSSPAEPDAAANSDQAALVACVGAKNTTADQKAEARSPDYKLGVATVSSDATSFANAADIATDVAILHSPKIDACYDLVLKAKLAGSLEPGQSIKSVSMKITPGAAAGPKNVAATGLGTITVAAGAKVVTIYTTVAFITGSKIEAEVDGQGIGQPVPAAITAPLIAKVAARVATART